MSERRNRDIDCPYCTNKTNCQFDLSLTDEPQFMLNKCQECKRNFVVRTTTDVVVNIHKIGAAE